MSRSPSPKPIARISFSGTEYQNLMKPCVYLFRCGKEVLYVGSSKNGIERPFQSCHHQAEMRIFCDNVKILWFNTWTEALQKEGKLIRKFQPVFNGGKRARIKDHSREDAALAKLPRQKPRRRMETVQVL
jgi:predicted GIY-YIG superfamily endonuclease